MQELFVDDAAALGQLCDTLRGSEWLALDTEFLREKTYYPKLCLLQVSNGEVAACVDPLRIEDLSPLLDILYDGSILKVFHAGRQDLEIFLHDWGRIPLPLFDTQPAAALLGFGDQVGYGKLVEQMLGRNLPKDQSRTDWSQRPLDEQQVRYALDDVVYLGEMYIEMRGRLSDRERLQWLAADFADLADPATYFPAPGTLWKRTKGRQQLKGRQLAVLQSLAAWREEVARDRDLPRKWVIKDEVLLELSRRMPTELNALGKIRGMDAGLIRREGKRLAAMIEAARNLPREQWPQDKARPRSLSVTEEALVDLLHAALRLIAEEHQLSPMAIATQKEVQKLVRGDADCALLDGWRRSIAGERLLALSKGDIQLKVEDGKPALG